MLRGFLLFNIATEVLRGYLEKMESEGATTFSLESEDYAALKSHPITRITALQILVAVGVVYAVALAWISYVRSGVAGGFSGGTVRPLPAGFSRLFDCTDVSPRLRGVSGGVTCLGFALLGLA